MTNSDIIKSILAEKGYSVFDVYVKSGRKRAIYNAFERNKFNKNTISFIESIINENLSMFINSRR